ncbi:hypothetical protein OS189_18380 [Sulfitobacter sp. F26169L]|uniref:hypothetical protein n=1 Tax=Sulfitobacter sp. F26169L TaxID=2996015 RepID=UPI002260BCF7|nr:hypothetical protein [Sulfitobacter sp. F26169L]MCX7568309.1 hypothetical protein [Sulfitobacter sp. F26169L]
MFLYELRKWILKVSVGDNKEAMCDVNIAHVEKLLEIEDNEAFVAMSLVVTAVEIAAVDGGEKGLLAFADYLREKADGIERRIKRHNFKVVRDRLPEPVNRE